MESDIGNPIEYNPNIIDKDTPEQAPSNDMTHEQPMYYYPPPPPQPQYQERVDVFSSLDKTAYVVMFVAFVLGFFMGKTMQPVILRPN